MPVSGTFRAYDNEPLRLFVLSLSEEEQVVAHKVIEFIRKEFPETEEAIRGKLIYEESW
jgi:hypothetical protein